MNIRKTTLDDLDVILKLYENARSFMARNGNPTQWSTNYPPVTMLEQDIIDRHSYVCVEDGRIIATFYFRAGKDDTYARIYEGEWLNDRPYGAVHRITSDGSVKGTASFCINWALSQCGNLKIDTHRDNKVMQHLLEKNGFTYCGIIYIDDGTDRLAYQKSHS